MEFQWIAVVLFVVWSHNSFYAIKAGQRGVVLRLGRIQERVLEPGLRIVIWPMDRVYRVSVLTQTVELSQQEMVTRDDATVKLKGRCILRVTDPKGSISQKVNYHEAVLKLTEEKLRQEVGGTTRNDLLADLEEVSRGVQTELEQDAKAWGLEIIAVELEQGDQW